MYRLSFTKPLVQHPVSGLVTGISARRPAPPVRTV